MSRKLLALWVSNFLSGIRDSCNITPIFYSVFYNPVLRKIVWKCVALNGVFLMTSMIVYLLIDKDFQLIFDILWFYPLYILSFVLSSIWYNRIAETGSKLVLINDESFDSKVKRILSNISEELYKMVLLSLFLLQGVLYGYIPYIGKVLFVGQLSLLYSFYLFDYVGGREEEGNGIVDEGEGIVNGDEITAKKSRFSRSIHYFQTHYSYLCGYSLFLSVITVVCPKFVGASIYALMFPFMLIGVTNRVIRNKTSGDMNGTRHIFKEPHLGIFIPVIWVAGGLLKVILRRR